MQMNVEQLLTTLEAIPRIERALSRISQQINSEKSEDIIDIEAASKFTGLSKSTLYSMTSKRTIPHIKRKDLNKIFFSKSRLERWLKEGERD